MPESRGLVRVYKENTQASKVFYEVLKAMLDARKMIKLTSKKERGGLRDGDKTP